MALPNEYELSGNVEFLLWEACGQGNRLSKTPRNTREKLIRGIIDKNQNIITKAECKSRVDRWLYAILTGDTTFFEYPQSRIEGILHDIHAKRLTSTFEQHLLVDANNDYIVTQDNDYILVWSGTPDGHSTLSRIELLLNHILENQIWH